MDDSFDKNDERLNSGPNMGCVWALVVTILGVIGLPLFFVAVMVIGGFNTFGGIITDLRELFVPEPPVATVDSRQTVITSLQPLGQLVSISAQVAKADIDVDIFNGGMNLCGHSAMHVAQGVVEAGIDMTQVDESSVVYDQESDTYTLTVPAPQLTSCRVEYIRQYERSAGVGCNINWDNARLLAQHIATLEFAEDAVNGGILDRAEREAQLLLENFVTAITDSEAQVVFASDGDIIYPPSCQPEPPGEWFYDEEHSAWVNGNP